MSGFFYNLGRQVGRKAVPAIRRSKWIWDGLTGTDEDALRAEVSLGTAMAAELRGAAAALNDPLVTQLANDIGRRLGACVRDKSRTFHCEVIREPAPNAMALPGGFIFVSHIMVQFCQRQPDELAFVIAHEMSHVILKHAWDRMLNQTALRAASALAARAGTLGVWFRQQGMQLLQSAHSREAEMQADELGVRLAKAAKFAPNGAVAFLRRVEELARNGSQLGQYFASHPPTTERIARLNKLLRDLGA